MAASNAGTNLRNGGKGCISATANVNPAAIHGLYASWQQPDADTQQERLDAVRKTFQRYPMIPALKGAIAHWGRNPAWRRVRPPLVELEGAQYEALVRDLEAVQFQMPGLGAGR